MYNKKHDTVQKQVKTGTVRDLLVWHQAMELAGKVYTYCAKLPRMEEHALSGQMRRAAISIPSNIAEGYGRSTKKEFQLNDVVGIQRMLSGLIPRVAKRE